MFQDDLGLLDNVTEEVCNYFIERGSRLYQHSDYDFSVMHHWWSSQSLLQLKPVYSCTSTEWRENMAIYVIHHRNVAFTACLQAFQKG